MGRTLVSPPAVMPVSLAEAKAHAKVETVDDDALINALIAAATAACESATGRALIHQTWRLHLDRWPSKVAAASTGADAGIFSVVAQAAAPVSLPLPPLVVVNHVKTYDQADIASVYPAANYYVDIASEPGRLVPRANALAPSAGRIANGIEIEFIAGYGLAGGDVPAVGARRASRGQLEGQHDQREPHGRFEHGELLGRVGR